MKPELPYRRRAKEIPETSMSQENTQSSKWPDLLRSVAASFFGASLASVFTLWITLGTLESFKAEENLRELALNDLYKPLIKASSECTATRRKLLDSMHRFEGHLKLSSGYLLEMASNARAGDIDQKLMPSSSDIGKFIDTASQTLESIGEHKSQMLACESENLDSWMTLAVVIGVNDEFSKHASERLEALSSTEGLIRDEDLFIQWVKDPKLGVSMLLAFSDGINGDQGRIISATAKITSELKKTSDHISKVSEQYDALDELLIRSDNNINRLMLKNLRGRFSKTPTTIGATNK